MISYCSFLMTPELHSPQTVNDTKIFCYDGLSASLLRQLTYSTTRFGIYEVVKQNISAPDENMPFYKKILIAAGAGAMGGLVGTPADMVNVRMQNDIKLPLDQRRNYKHAIDGLIQVYHKEGVRYLFSGATTATSRAVLMTIGQISFYDQIKQLLLQTAYFSDNLVTHFAASTMAGAIATTLTQPLDVLKTRMMNAKPGEYKNVWHCITITARLGPLGFFKGYVPAFVRLAPHTVLTFIFFEQLRINFGVRVAVSSIARESVLFILPKKKKSLSGEVILITGSAQGIGRQLALNLSREGAKIVLWDINVDKLKNVAKEITEDGGEQNGLCAMLLLRVKLKPKLASWSRKLAR
ncbi:mitochondrial dicarboxylate carrier [Caerostris extrusa]|uniref:Mitochondrial dicarboxylate carrier n=1 Tax=Caerostris extrusa TaxID=172846 RepID=A0AAV4R2Q3_CAEEX|nr:mitochondrial dicarboxylate carrier [Caerostris extrusa]